MKDAAKPAESQNADRMIDVPPSLRSARDGNGRFVIPWPMEDSPSRGIRDIARWYAERMRTGVAPNPPADAFPPAEPDIAAPRNATDELRITWIGHATFLIQLAGITILTDPMWSRRASPIGWAGPARLVPPGLGFDALPTVDVVVLSHDHYDHLDSRTVRRLQARFDRELTWVTPLGYASWLRRFGVENVVELDWWEAATVNTPGGPLQVRATPAQHWSKRSPFGERTRLWSGFVLSAGPQAQVYFCGDSGYFGGFDAIGTLGPFAASLMPIGAYDPRWFMKPAHMNPEEAVRAYTQLGDGGLFVAMHYATFRLTDELPLEPQQRADAAWRDLGLPPDRLWIPRHGETRIMPVGR
ncbi:MAG TPA: MBL fold metallo-hydrolase [Longimicrobiales bacterium]|nr:MBL fold metallo-hydrolase [Longimicrobiales bacterium]